MLDDETTAANREAILDTQRASVRNGLPANRAAVPSYKTDIVPTRKRGPNARRAPPLPAMVPPEEPPPAQDIPKPVGGPIRVILRLYSG